jgi:hypothetical protein
LQHVEVPVPTPKKDELLLKLEATSINPMDWYIQKGMLRFFLPRKFPHIPGNSLLLIVSINRNFCDSFLYLAREHILIRRSHWLLLTKLSHKSNFDYCYYFEVSGSYYLTNFDALLKLNRMELTSGCSFNGHSLINYKDKYPWFWNTTIASRYQRKTCPLFSFTSKDWMLSSSPLFQMSCLQHYAMMSLTLLVYDFRYTSFSLRIVFVNYWKYIFFPHFFNYGWLGWFRLLNLT